MDSSADWTCPQKASMSLKINNRNFPTEMKKEQKNPQKNKRVEHPRNVGSFLERCNICIIGRKKEITKRKNYLQDTRLVTFLYTVNEQLESEIRKSNTTFNSPQK